MTKRKKWSEMTTGQQTAIVVGAGVQLSLLAGAIWDMWHRPVAEIRGDRRLWTLVSFVNIAGPLAYFLFGRKHCC